MSFAKLRQIEEARQKALAKAEELKREAAKIERRAINRRRSIVGRIVLEALEADAILAEAVGQLLDERLKESERGLFEDLLPGNGDAAAPEETDAEAETTEDTDGDDGEDEVDAEDEAETSGDEISDSGFGYADAPPAAVSGY